MAIDRGWTLGDIGGVYHFEHVPRSVADAAADVARFGVFVVETINWALAEGDPDQVHRNLYFARGLAGAFAVASHLTIALGEDRETVTSIRRATDDETERWSQSEAHFLSNVPGALAESSR